VNRADEYSQSPALGGERIGVGTQFFNLFNHPNFDQPGSIIGTVNTPTSIWVRCSGAMLTSINSAQGDSHVLIRRPLLGGSARGRLLF
jgi:hypothetical protein